MVLPAPLVVSGYHLPTLVSLLTTFRLALDTDADEATAAWFLDHGADPDARCPMDMTPLSIAMQYAPLSIKKCSLPTYRHLKTASYFTTQPGGPLMTATMS